MDKTALSQEANLTLLLEHNELNEEVLLERRLDIWAKNVFPRQHMYLMH